MHQKGKKKVRQAIKELSSDKTLIIVSHNAEFLLETVDRILVVESGKIIAKGTPLDILANSELLQRADLEPTIACQIADGIGLSESLLTVDKLLQEIGNRPLPYWQKLEELYLINASSASNGRVAKTQFCRNF